MANHEFIPARSTHAITGVALACEMAVPVSSVIIKALADQYESSAEVKGFLPRKSEDQGFTFALDNKTARIEQPGGLMGVSFERFSPDGTLEWSLSLRGNLLLVSCNVYTRWSEVFPEAVQLLRWGLEAISPVGIGVVAYGLQYQDEFIWPDDPSSMDSTLLFADETDFMPRHFLGKKGMWHNYSGWFDEAVTPVPGVRLVNMNVAFIQRESNGIANGIAQLVVSHKGIYKDHKDAPSDPSLLFDALHNEHKVLLSKLLTEQIKQKIKLDQ